MASPVILGSVVFTGPAGPRPEPEPGNCCSEYRCATSGGGPHERYRRLCHGFSFQ
jgi:hypothetical protein